MTDFYIRKSTDLTDYECDQTTIIKKKFLQYISRVKYKEETPSAYPQIVEWYPYTNSYYPYTEDVDAFARVSHLLGSKGAFESFTSIPNCENIYDQDAYSERTAQLQYLSSNPISFLILGKPGIGEQELGKLLAEHWQCVYVDPETLINEEIASESRAGQCIEFNLRCGRAIGIEIIMRLMEKRVRSKSAQHRGFVICGFPLIPNDLYEEDPVSSESAVFTVQEIFEEIFETTIEIGVPPEVPKVKISNAGEEAPGEEDEAGGSVSEVPPSEKTVKLPPQEETLPPDLGSASSNICVAGDMTKNYEDQINCIFSYFQKPFIIIYISCSNRDVVTKHASYRFDFYTGQSVDLQIEHYEKEVYTVFSTVPGAVTDDIPEDFMNVVKVNTVSEDTIRSRQLVKLPKDFPCNIATLLEQYRYSALPVIEKYVLTHDSQYFIKIDGRISPARLFNAVKMRLRVLPLQRVLLPQKLLVAPESDGEGSPVEDINVEELSFEECFENFRKRRIASPIFKWGLSDWGVKCPVSMKDGSYKDGNPKYAVQFMNKIFFLADQDAYLKFYRNPRPYLLPPYPKLSCKIFVMGPPRSGKTAVAKCLGYFLKGEVLHFDELVKQFLVLKRSEREDQIRSAALNEGIALLNEQRRLEWEKLQKRRQEKVEFWLLRQQDLLRETLDLQAQVEEETEDVELLLEMSSFPSNLQYGKSKRTLTLTSTEDFDPTELRNIRRTIEELQQLIEDNGLPVFDDLSLCKELLNDREKLLEYLPPVLQPPETYDMEPATIFDDFVKEYAERAVREGNYDELDLSADNVVDFLVETTTQVENRNQEQGNNKGGWIVDGITANVDLFTLLIPRCLPDDIFVLKDTEDHEFLLKRYKNKTPNDFRDFRKFFMDLGQLDAAWCSPSLQSTDSYRDHLTKDILSNLLDETYFSSEEKNREVKEGRPRGPGLETYENELNKFDETWDNLLNVISDFKITVTELQARESLDGLLKDVIKNVEDRYRQLASEFTSIDRAQEVEDLGEPEMHGEDMGEGEEKDTEDLFFQNRRFGDTFNYCPVAFSNHWVLWKGKEEHAAKFENKLYLMCSEDAKDSFINDPRRYLLINKPPDDFPPPRICIVGPQGSGKTTLVKALCRNIGLYNANYSDMVKNAIAPKSKFNLSEVIKMGIAGTLGEDVQNYLVSDEPLSPKLMSSMLLPLWFEEPMKSFGFAIDGFPKRPSDVQFMTEFTTIPDIVVELSISQAEIHDRLVQEFIANWQKLLDEKQDMLNKKRAEITNAWEEWKNARFKELMDIRKEERYAAKVKKQGLEGQTAHRTYLGDIPEVEEEDRTGLRAKSQVSYDSVEEEADVEEVSKIIAREIPEPVFEDEPDESLEEAVEKFIVEIDDSYNAELGFLRQIRELCEKELVPWVTVDAGVAEDKVFAQAMRVVDKFKFRSNSLFERVYSISLELADRLLSSGYYFLSKFGKTCPVQVYENINPVQMFLPLEQKYQLFPVIHRQYIYFLAQKRNLEKFKEDPLKYIFKKNVDFPLLPLKIAITGPPKSGKTTLAERFRRDLGLRVISMGKAGRYVLKYLEFSELAKHMESVLRRGWEMTNEMMMKCVQAMTYDGRSITQGFVLDGFPNHILEVRHLAEVGLVPILIIDLQATRVDTQEFLASSVGERNLPVFSRKFIGHRWDEWSRTSDAFRDLLEKEYQIMGKVPVKPSKWGVWNASYELAAAVFSETKHYFKYAHCDMALRLANMLVTPLEYIERQCSYKNYCPCCLHYNRELKCGGDPPDRTGVVQFRKYFYYLCPEHIDKFINNPEQFVSPHNNHPLPADLPIPLVLSERPEQQLHEEGICIVCFWENLPKQVVKKGELEHAVMYREKVYLFDKEECMEKFMRRPHDYFAKVVNFKGALYPSLNYEELPVLGRLQQYDIKQVTRAIQNTEALRPVIPGLSIACAASLNIGLSLKLSNSRTPQKFIHLYRAAQERYHERRTNLIKYLADMKKMINPYLYYDEVLPRFVDPLADALASKRELLTLQQQTTEVSELSNVTLTEESESTVSASYQSFDDYIYKISTGG